MSEYPTMKQEWLLSLQTASRQAVGVIGAGTMGAGIAQVAAAAGHPVRLLDLRPNAARAAHDNIGAALSGLVGKGRMSEQEREAILARIVPVDALANLADAALVVEVIVEKLEAKQSLLRELETHVNRHTILASNTSSISITALANGMQYPDRVVGMHFFNPVPLMKLVEVVSGMETAISVAEAIADLARRWGKEPVHAKSTPGFIVNRIARPFYAEALALLQEQAATPQQLDRAARSAGFRMGPCELMDLIGHDINYSVTVSVFDANYADRRYVPSLVQKALLDGGRLGRKSGKGFYEGVAPVMPELLLASPAVAIEIVGNSAIAVRLADWLAGRQVVFSRCVESNWHGLRIGDTQLHITDGRCAAQVSAERGTRALGVIDLPLVSERSDAIAIAFAPGLVAEERAAISATLAACGLQAIEMRDVPGLLVARTIAMLINEGADAVHQGVCDEPGADLAMKLGTNYPAGPFEWLQQIGVDYTVDLLNNLFSAYRSERYRVSPLLQQRFWNKRMPT
ncbi:3-hydroxyacyl-CoA dehydrogenase [Collimonas sp. OK607]|uniref:3-hydroxyacyl-CoA dehydrogenase n=1 Tax=Collimonas sp. OK607 TaxID=1798194 RepID=UPI0008F37D65|nr:3-hydroxyacyl-CoA dehydrogenase [Collimonas sp. OK607]SFB00980.1 3-hydroxyacyl-CoA dehydrogenase [Collimonas sp. OK607]